MEYLNQEKLLLPEYGRNVKKLIEHAIGIEDREMRTKFCSAIVDLMLLIDGNINKDSLEAKQKYWNHLIIISKFKIDIDLPEGIEKVEYHEFKNTPRMEYPMVNIPFKNYGSNSLKFIKHLAKIQKSDEFDIYLEAIANYMKGSYYKHNGAAASDEMIKEHIKEMSGKQLELRDDFIFSKVNITTNRTFKKVPGKNYSNKNRNFTRFKRNN